jgi:hypothetical protein
MENILEMLERSKITKIKFIFFRGGGGKKRTITL